MPRLKPTRTEAVDNLACSVAGVVLLLLSCPLGCERGASTHARLESFRGEKVDLVVSKGLWVEHLASAEYRAVTPTAVHGNWACFRDHARRFQENAGRLRAAVTRGEAPPVQIISPEQFCVQICQISALRRDGRRVWGTGSAYPCRE